MHAMLCVAYQHTNVAPTEEVFKSTLGNMQGGGIFHVRVGAVLTQHKRGRGGIFHRLCWGCVNTSNSVVWCCVVLCCVVLCCVVCCVLLCCVVLCCVVLCCVVLCCVVCGVVLFLILFCFFVAVSCRVVFFFFFLVLCCVVLCCVVLCWWCRSGPAIFALLCMSPLLLSTTQHNTT